MGKRRRHHIRKQLHIIKRHGLKYEIESIKNRLFSFYDMSEESILRFQNYYENLDESQYEEELVEWFNDEMGYKMNINHPLTFCEKMQWLKLNDRDPIKTELADKYSVRKWVENKIGEEYMVPLKGVWNSAEDIPYEEMPQRFVVKCNHGSGMNVIVKNKDAVDWGKIKSRVAKWQLINYAHINGGFELHYEGIKKRIVVEEYLEDLAGALYDYKFYCFGGEPQFVIVIGNRSERHHSGCEKCYDMNWRFLDWPLRDYPLFSTEIPKPQRFSEMKSIAKTLSEGFRFVRIDLYEANGKIYFGEMTFIPSNGVFPYRDMWTHSRDCELGSMISLI